MSATASAGTSPRAAVAPVADAPRLPGRRLPLVLELARLLDEAGIAYCHWKSNAAIDRSLSGENDLDLLVRRADVRRFTELLSRLGFVRARKRGAPGGGIESFYGYDPEADRLVHVHAHYRLVLGHDCTKNYSLPIEDEYIASATAARVLRLPSPEFEYVVLVIRMVLKYCTWDEILWCALRGRRAQPTKSERRELDDLRVHAGEQRAGPVLDAHLPFLGRALFHDCVEAVVGGAPAWRRIGTARALERVLQPHGRRSRRVDRLLRICGRIALVVARRAHRLPRNRLAGGGALIALTGGDGAGKTTALAELDRWLRAEFDVKRVHLGKPRWSATTIAVRTSLKGAYLATRGVERLVPTARTRRWAHLVAAYRRVIWLACTARDRHLAYRRARRFTIAGGVVLCDRYPDPRLRSMDVPQIARLAAGSIDGHLVRALIRVERRYHALIAPPELLVVLRVDPEVAVNRKTDERPESVRARGAEVSSIDWEAAGIPVVDANQPEDAVLRDLKALVWTVLG